MAVAGEVKIILAADAASYSAALDKAKAQLKQFEGSAQSAGTTARKEMNEARGTVMVLGEEIGVHLPRHVQRFLAELPGVAPVIAGAFSAVAIVALGAAAIEAGKKIYEFALKNEEAAEKNARSWRALSQPLAQTEDELRLVNDRLQDSIAKLEGKPANGMKAAIDEALVAADKLGKQLDENLDKISKTLKDTQVGILGQITGNAGDSDLAKRAHGLQGELAGINDQERARLNSLREQHATQKQLDQATEEFNQKRLKALSDEQKWIDSQISTAEARQRSNDIRQAEAARNLQIGPSPTSFLSDQKQRIEQLRRYGSNLGSVEDITRLTQDNFSAQNVQAALQAAAAKPVVPGYNPLVSNLSRFSAQDLGLAHNWNAAPGLPLQMSGGASAGSKPLDELSASMARLKEAQAAATRAIEMQSAKVDLDTGAISKHQYALEIANAHADEFAAKMKAIQDAIDALKIEGWSLWGDEALKNQAQILQLQTQMVDEQGKYKVQSIADLAADDTTTPLGQLKRTVMDLEQQFTNLGQVLSNEFVRGLDEFNQTLMQVVSTPKSWMRGEHPWRNLGAGIAENAGGAALRFGEGELMKLITGFDPKKQQQHVIVDNWPGGNGSGGVSLGHESLGLPTGLGGGLMGALNDSNWAGKLFGGKLFGSGSFFGSGGGFSSLLGGLGHFAEGGMIPSNLPSIVGERGPELFMPGTPGRIVANKDLSMGGQGDVHFHFDNRGAGDPAAVEAASRRAVAQALPTARRMAINDRMDYNRRVAPSKRI